MIVAGFGMGSRVTAEALLALYATALARAGLSGGAVACLATLAERARLPAFAEAAARLELPARAVDAAALAASASRVATISPRILARYGVGSVAEAAALAGASAGARGARLILPRLQAGAATCALAETFP